MEGNAHFALMALFYQLVSLQQSTQTHVYLSETLAGFKPIFGKIKRGTEQG